LVLQDTAEPPVYQQIARKELQLRKLGLSHIFIAERLQVTDKTVAKAVRWIQRKGLTTTQPE